MCFVDDTIYVFVIDFGANFEYVSKLNRKKTFFQATGLSNHSLLS